MDGRKGGKQFLPGHQVRVRFRHATGEEDMVEVELRDPEAFKQAVRTIQSEVRSLSPIST
jgi:hypothetical protein